MATPLMRDDRGYEMQFATNHLGHFQLTGNRRAQIHYLQLSWINAVKSMVFVRSRRIQGESSPILAAT